MLGLVSAIMLSRLAAPRPVDRTGLDRVVRATVPLHAEDWVAWDRVCLMPKPGWCFSAAPHKGTTGGGWKEAPCGKRPCWVVYCISALFLTELVTLETHTKPRPTKRTNEGAQNGRPRT